MKDDITPQGALFNELVNLQVHVRFDQPDSSSDSGAFLLKALDKCLGLSQRLSECLRDKAIHCLSFTATTIYCVNGNMASVVDMRATDWVIFQYLIRQLHIPAV